MDFWAYLILFSIVLLGGVLSQIAMGKDSRTPWMKGFITISGSYLLGIVFLHIFPIVYSQDSNSIGLYILLGFAIQVTLDRFSRGIEHGHLHIHESGIKEKTVGILIALCVHSFLEGLPLSHMEDLTTSTLHHHDYHHNYLLGIVLHKLPAAFTLATFLFILYGKKIKSWLFLLLFALMTPLGGILSHLLVISPEWQGRILALVAGSLIHISTTILYEVDSKGEHQLPWSKILLIVLGIAAAYISEMI